MSKLRGKWNKKSIPLKIKGADTKQHFLDLCFLLKFEYIEHQLKKIVAILIESVIDKLCNTPTYSSSKYVGSFH